MLTINDRLSNSAFLNTGRNWLSRRRLHPVVIALVLYGATVALLLVRIGTYPNYAYNWESYTAWRFFPFWDQPTRHIFTFTDGLMTDSGRSPLIIFPAWIGFQIGGVGLTSLRVPIALIAGFSVPILWFIARRFAPPSIALLAAGLLALSPAFALYARTATLVGISLTPALLTIYALLRVVQRSTQWRWLIALQMLLIVNSFAYAPIRFLWPLSVVLLVGEALWRTGFRRQFVLAGLITALALPLVVLFLGKQPNHNIQQALKLYYNGRGEQVFSLRADPAAYQYYLRDQDDSTAARNGESSTELALLLIKQNSKDLISLLLSHNTRSAITDYWNPHGRLYPWFLVPFFLIGLLKTIRRCGRDVENRFLLVLFGGFTLPMIATSQVHIGRLIFALPLICLFVAIGAQQIAMSISFLSQHVTGYRFPEVVRFVLVIALLVAGGWSAWQDFQVVPNPSREAVITSQLRAAAPTLRNMNFNAALVLGNSDQLQIETISVAAIRLNLDSIYLFVNAANKQVIPQSSTRPIVYYGALLDFPTRGTDSLLPCNTVYYVDRAIYAEFFDTLSRYSAQCQIPPRIEILST